MKKANGYSFNNVQITAEQKAQREEQVKRNKILSAYPEYSSVAFEKSLSSAELERLIKSDQFKEDSSCDPFFAGLVGFGLGITLF
ncbi:hypothetical protein ACMXYX_18020 (plasmid) [Neptuniibacter sp. QD72_48]|uniref:hypothetical protein n=1 Tax=Neptuniibacter sp. QD72_48 TaxID=3398214 RepID=UPI0039F482B8